MSTVMNVMQMSLLNICQSLSFNSLHFNRKQDSHTLLTNQLMQDLSGPARPCEPNVGPTKTRRLQGF